MAEVKPVGDWALHSRIQVQLAAAAFARELYQLRHHGRCMPLMPVRVSGDQVIYVEESPPSQVFAYADSGHAGHLLIRHQVEELVARLALAIDLLHEGLLGQVGPQLLDNGKAGSDFRVRECNDRSSHAGKGVRRSGPWQS